MDDVNNGLTLHKKISKKKKKEWESDGERGRMMEEGGSEEKGTIMERIMLKGKSRGSEREESGIFGRITQKRNNY